MDIYKTSYELLTIGFKKKESKLKNGSTILGQSNFALTMTPLHFGS
jgi:hypothetical protein